MTTDIYLVTGVVVLVLAIPSILNALLDGHAPRTAAITLLIGGGLVYLAVLRKPGGYRLEDVPEAFLRVVSYVIN